MAIDNFITIVGNLTRDPELRFVSQDKPVASFSVAVNRRVRNPQTGDWEDKLDGFFNCSAWDSLANNVQQSLHKGDRVIVTGRLSEQSWNDAQGNERKSWNLTVDEVAPSLRWATAQLTRVSKGGGGFGGNQNFGGNQSYGGSAAQTNTPKNYDNNAGQGFGNDSNPNIPY